MASITETLAAHGQEHLLTGLDQLAVDERDAFHRQLATLDLAELRTLYMRKDEKQTALPPPERIAPLVVESRNLAASSIGEDALRRGEVAVLLVAGGQGSRLGSDKPKGMYPVGPVTDATLFQIHAEKVFALRKRYAAAVPFLVMTSPATHAETVAEFTANNFYGLPADDVHFFQQGTMPALDLATGKLILEKPGKLFLSPNGHGGTLTALADTGLLAKLKARGVQHIFYFQVDNPLVRIADPAFLGRHIETESEASSKVVFKDAPEEKVGILALVDGRCNIIEYSDMPAAMTNARDADGTLLYRAGNPAIHLFSVSFLERVTSGTTRLAHHVAKKKVPYHCTIHGTTVTPTTENALKFEMFVFDALPAAERWLAVSVDRQDEFAPLKNATGADSPATVRSLQLKRNARWLTAAGATVPLNAEGEPEHAIEISPLFALDEAECAAKIGSNLEISGPLILR